MVGDTHGQFKELMKIFSLVGLPSDENPYIFNGDFVDRGDQGAEVLLTLLLFKILYPKSVFLNRGNHEFRWITDVYGFRTECEDKYSSHIYSKFHEVFAYLHQLSKQICCFSKQLQF